MSNKKKALIIIFVIVLVITACTYVPLKAAENQQEAVSDSHQEEVFQFLGIIGKFSSYSVYRMTDGDKVCYIVLDEYVSSTGNSNSAPAIHCP
jgi:hypothetical protein